jgi:transcriptional regulator with XRE-family HTH domain
VEQDWGAAGRAVSARLAELGITQTELANRSNVSLSTVREIAQNLNARRRNPKTLSALATALGWPEDAFTRLLRGGEPAAAAAPPGGGPVEAELHAIRTRLDAMQDQLDALTRRPAGSARNPPDLVEIKSLLEEIIGRLDATPGTPAS